MSATESGVNVIRRPTQVAALDVFLVLLRDARSQVLCGLRGAVDFAAGQWGLPSGKIETGEDPFAALLRETREETGLLLQLHGVDPAGVVHARFPGERPRVGFVFAVEYDSAAHGEPNNTEPDKCDRLAWYDVSALPTPFESYNQAALQLALSPANLALFQPDTGEPAAEHRSNPVT